MKEVTLDQAPEILARGEILVYPTETLYGLGVDVKNSLALERLFSLKKRDPSKPVSVLVGSSLQLAEVAQPLSPLAQFLWDRFMPGALTLVIPARSDLDRRIHGGSACVGIRHSSYPWVKILMAKFGRPITTTSANFSGEAGGQTVQQLWRDFSDEDHVCLLNGGDLPPSKGSTVIQVEGENIRLLREGDISFAKIQEVCEGRTHD
jgi:L-threonylcarbamoyladenylate synthase